MPRPIVLDVDTGTDDALALLYAVGLPRPRPARGELRGGQRRAGPGGRQHAPGPRRGGGARPPGRGRGHEAVHRARADRGAVPRRERAERRRAAGGDPERLGAERDGDALRADHVVRRARHPRQPRADDERGHAADAAPRRRRPPRTPRLHGRLGVAGQRHRGGRVQRLAGPRGGDLRGRVRAARHDVRARRVQPPADPAGGGRPVGPVRPSRRPRGGRAPAPPRHAGGRRRAGLRGRPRGRGRSADPHAPRAVHDRGRSRSG